VVVVGVESQRSASWTSPCLQHWENSEMVFDDFTVSSANQWRAPVSPSWWNSPVCRHLDCLATATFVIEMNGCNNLHVRRKTQTWTMKTPVVSSAPTLCTWWGHWFSLYKIFQASVRE
jgi:hypothetical protein